MKRIDGFTFVEIALTAALIALVILSMSRLGTPLLTFLQRGRARQEAQTEGRICLETVGRVLANGIASTVTISNSASTPAMPGGQIQFLSVDGSSVTISWSNTPPNSVHLHRTPPGSDTVLATTVAGFSFAWNPADPSIMNVYMSMSIPLDASGSPGSMMSILLPTQTIQMISS